MGQVLPNAGYVDELGESVQVTGGNPAALTGPINLCTRSDNNVTRYFDGRVAYLGKAALLFLITSIAAAYFDNLDVIIFQHIVTKLDKICVVSRPATKRQVSSRCS